EVLFSKSKKCFFRKGWMPGSSAAPKVIPHTPRSVAGTVGRPDQDHVGWIKRRAIALFADWGHLARAARGYLLIPTFVMIDPLDVGSVRSLSPEGRGLG